MQSAKKTVQALLDTLPDDCSVEDILYHLYVIDKVVRGLADVAAGRTTNIAQSPYPADPLPRFPIILPPRP